MNLENVIKTLENQQAVWVSLLEEVEQEQAQWKPDKGRWSLLEIINHMADIEAEDFRTDLGIILLNPEENWPSFDELAWIESRQYNKRFLEESLARLCREREQSIHFLINHKDMNLFAEHKGEGLKRTMRAGDVLSSWIAHDLFHLRQLLLLLWEINSKLNKPFSSEYSGFYV